MKVIIIEDCSADDLASVLRPYTDHIADAGEMVPAPHKTTNPRAWSEEETAPIAAAGSRDEALRAYFEMFPDSLRTRKAVEGRWYRLHQAPEADPDPEPEPEPVIATPEPDPEPVPVGHSRSWQAVENDVVAQCASWPQAVEAYKEAFPESLRTAHAVEMRWYYLRKKGLLVPQEDVPEVAAPVEVPGPVDEIPVDLQPETPAAEVTTLCDLPEWPEPPTDAEDVENEDVIKALINTRCQADIPAEGSHTKYVKGYIRRVLSDRHVLIECDAGAMCWCSLDCVTLLGGAA